MRFTNEGRDRRVTPSYKLFIELSVQPIYIFILCFHPQKHQISGQGWTRTNKAEAPDLQSGVIAAIRPTHTKRVCSTHHTLLINHLFNSSNSLFNLPILSHASAILSRISASVFSISSPFSQDHLFLLVQ